MVVLEIFLDLNDFLLYDKNTREYLFCIINYCVINVDEDKNDFMV